MNSFKKGVNWRSITRDIVFYDSNNFTSLSKPGAFIKRSSSSDSCVMIAAASEEIDTKWATEVSWAHFLLIFTNISFKLVSFSQRTSLEAIYHISRSSLWSPERLYTTFLTYAVEL